MNPNDFTFRELVTMADGKSLSEYTKLAYLAAVVVNAHSTQSVTVDEMMVYNSIFEEENKNQAVTMSAVDFLAANAEQLGMKVVNKRIDEA